MTNRKRWLRDIIVVLLGAPVGAIAGLWVAGFITVIKERIEWARDESS